MSREVAKKIIEREGDCTGIQCPKCINYNKACTPHMKPFILDSAKKYLADNPETYPPRFKVGDRVTFCKRISPRMARRYGMYKGYYEHVNQYLTGCFNIRSVYVAGKMKKYEIITEEGEHFLIPEPCFSLSDPQPPADPPGVIIPHKLVSYAIKKGLTFKATIGLRDILSAARENPPDYDTIIQAIEAK